MKATADVYIETPLKIRKVKRGSVVVEMPSGVQHKVKEGETFVVRASADLRQSVS